MKKLLIAIIMLVTTFESLNSAPLNIEQSTAIDRVTKAMMNQWPPKSNSPYTHMVILIGGFQGSGKSILAENLMKKGGFSIVSTDKIRFLLNEERQLITESVKKVEKDLLSHAFKVGRAVVIDANGHSSRIAAVENLLCDHPSYRVVKVLLRGSETILKERISQRQDRVDAYNGTSSDLFASMKKHHLDPSIYDLVFDIETVSAEDISNQVIHFLEQGID